jgi:hypothetical protein
MRTLFDKFVWNEFERPKDGPKGARAGTARVIPLSANLSLNWLIVKTFLFINNFIPPGICIFSIYDLVAGI